MLSPLMAMLGGNVIACVPTGCVPPERGPAQDPPTLSRTWKRRIPPQDERGTSAPCSDVGVWEGSESKRDVGGRPTAAFSSDNQSSIRREDETRSECHGSGVEPPGVRRAPCIELRTLPIPFHKQV